MPTAADVRARRARHLARGRTYRIAFALAGFTLTLIGIVLWLFPVVPGGILAFVGRAMLALEFAWAERLLGRSLDIVERYRARRAPRREARDDAQDEQRREAV